MFPFIEIVMPTYAVLATIGAIAAAVFLFFRMDKYKISYSGLLSYIVFGAIAMFIGSRVVFAISIIPSMHGQFSVQRLTELILTGGIVFYGGLLGGILGIFICSKIKKDDAEVVFNYFTPAIPLFHAFGGIGCFLGGCCYGVECSWGFSMAATPRIIRFPVQLVESCCNILIFVLLVIIEKKKNGTRLLPVYLSLYSICRFILEFFRGDVERGLWGVLSTSQIIALIILAVCAADAVFRLDVIKKKTKAEYSE